MCTRSTRFFGKTFTSIITQGTYGGNKIVDYRDFAGSALGFNTVKGSCVLTIDPVTEKQQRKIDRTLVAHARRYYTRLERHLYPMPKLIHLMFFRMGRTRVRLELDESERDYTYCADKGCFDADYYYPTRPNVLKKGAREFFDWMFASMTKAR